MEKFFLKILILPVFLLHFEVNSLRCWKCNKQKCDEIWEGDCDLDSCVSAKGFNTTGAEEIQIKACKAKEDIAEFCKTVKGSCVSCNEDLCNEGGTKCFYSVATSNSGSIASETTCFDKSYRCFSIKDLKNNNTNMIRGCVDKGKATALCKNYTEDGFSCSTCEGDFCNTERIERGTKSDLTCYECNFGCLEERNETCPPDDDYSCLSVHHIKPNDYKVKKCIRKKEIEATCNEYKKDGSTCTTCDSNFCNHDRSTKELQECYSINTSEGGLVRKTCPSDTDFSCISARKIENGKFVGFKDCVVKERAARECKEYEKKGYVCQTCSEPLCNLVSVPKCYSCSNGDRCRKQQEETCRTESSTEYACFSIKGAGDAHEKGCFEPYKDCVNQTRYTNIKQPVCDICFTELCNPPGLNCYDCGNAGYCHGTTMSCFDKNFKCFMAEGKDEKGKLTKIKGCVHNDKAGSKCEEYKKKGYSCSVCDKDLCNKKSAPVRKCFVCDSSIRESCENPKIVTCPGDDEYSCISIQFNPRFTPEYLVQEKKCVPTYAIETECKTLEPARNAKCEACHTDLCNDAQIQKSKGYRSSLQLSTLMMTTVLLQICVNCLSVK